MEKRRLNLTLEPELAERFNRYIVEVVKRRGMIPYALRTKIVYAALNEWLDAHEKDYDIIK
jgi:metal-responsive CopG/Arc/MetJ family transcriptional regulator